ncbi:BsuPI-related putative proteinase inhibitor [Candidatus Palauibacter sp.]|uniref:BsuPI-related putative proteinase inhibitor n=1 Tax=Candidatus Palauibacter sp. TaxID=3101350 RepID=UPI003C6ED9D7
MLPAFVPLACLMAALSAPDLRLALSLGEAPPTAGMPIVLELAATNDGEAPLVLDFPDGQRYDFEVFSEDGASVWRWAEGMFFTMMLGRERLDPGTSLRWTERIADGLPAGVYRVLATLTTVEPHTIEGTLTVLQ